MKQIYANIFRYPKILAYICVMSHIGKNIKKIRSVKKISQNAFSELFKLSRTAVGSYEEGRAEPKIETIIQIANYFGLSIDLLLTKELTVNDLYRFDIFDIDKKGEKEVLPIAEKNIIPFISLKKRKDYLKHRGSVSFIASLPIISFPVHVNISLRAFEHEGDEMMFQGVGIHPYDILVCTPIKKEKLIRLEKNEVYIFVLESTIIVRRLDAENEDTYLLSSDNVYYPKKEIKRSEVKEQYKLIGLFSTEPTKPTVLNDRLTVLEEQVQYLLNHHKSS